MAKNAPAPYGATKAPTRDERENKPYRFQAYPSCRFHPDGRTVIVNHEEEDAALPKPWSDKPFPADEQPVQMPPARTVADVEAELLAKVLQFNKSWADLLATNTALRDENARLQQQVEELTPKAEAPAAPDADEPPADAAPKADAPAAAPKATASKSELKRQAAANRKSGE